MNTATDILQLEDEKLNQGGDNKEIQGNGEAQPRKLPPMLEQYLEYKKNYPDCLILCQVGDFYEIFFDDAVTVSRELNLTLTSRDKNNPSPIPMCGVPLTVIDNYVDRLVDLGYSVAIISQAELASEAKGMVKRKLERIITPAIRLSGASDAESSVVVSVYFENEKNVSISFCDVQSGKVYCRENIQIENLKLELSRISPKEIIVLQNLGDKRIDRRTLWIREIEKILPETIIKYKPESYTRVDCGGTRQYNEIEGYSSLSNATKKSVRLLLNYFDEITVDKEVKISQISLCSYEKIMGIDAIARKNLELVSNQKDAGKRNSLFDYMDCTVTVGGEKLLRNWILSPLIDIEKIKERQKAISFFKDNISIRTQVRNALKYICNFERLGSRIEISIVSPQELGVLRDSLLKLPSIISFFQEEKENLPQNIKNILYSLNTDGVLLSILKERLIDSPSFSVNEGNIIKDGYNEEVDKLRYIRKNGCSWILDLEKKEREETGVSSLKIKYNNVLGYFIELTKANKDKAPERYISRQSTAQTERFFTEELKQREKEVLGAEVKLFSLERELFFKLKEDIAKFSMMLRGLGEGISLLDLYSSLGELAEKDNLVLPQILEDKSLNITSGKHPVLMRALKTDFVSNSLLLDDKSFFAILTGPNMGGKSTFLRQCALIVIMAQIGSFVPATNLSFGLVDKIFARLGASDDMEEGESTFMVEMREASNILSNATDRSLVLIDEIGRGTATSDGLSIAQAILEYLVTKIGCRTVFATHFHELTLLSNEYKQIKNLSVASIESGSGVIFTHEIVEGPAKKSYGIHVAKLAGISHVILRRASQILKSFDEKSEKASCQMSFFDISLDKENFENKKDDYDLFKEDEVKIVEKIPEDYDELKELSSKIEKININNITPLEALNILNDLTKKEAI